MTQTSTLQAVVFDWAGTVLDFGCFAPLDAFSRAFASFGVPVSIAQARGPMGLAKRDHIMAVAAVPVVAAAWRAAKGHAFGSSDADAVLSVFEPINCASVADHAAFVPGFLDTLAYCRTRNLRIGSTTGYTRTIMAALEPIAKRGGYEPDIIVCAGDLPAGRPSPLMMWRAMSELGVWPAHTVVKVDDTAPGIGEGIAAGTWTVGVTLSGNEVGRTPEELARLGKDEVSELRSRAEAVLKGAGAHIVIDTIADLPAALIEIDARVARGETP